MIHLIRNQATRLMAKHLPAILASSFLMLMVFAAPAAAQTFTHSALFDSDNDALTGCTVNSAAGSVSGIELRITASVSGVPPQVDSVTRETCSGAAFGAAVTVGGGYPVALNGGVGGADAIEMAFAFADLPMPVASDWRVAFLSESSIGADLMGPVALSGIGGAAAPPALTNPELIPAISPAGLIGLSVVMAFLLLWGARRHRGALSVLLLCGSLTMFGVALAAGFIADGNLGDWSGESTAATDASGDSTSSQNNIDLVAGFVARESGQVFVRMDVNDAEDQNHVPAIANQTFSIDENSANASAVGTVIASDSDAADTLTYAITAGNGSGTFAIDVNTGAITVANNTALDYETMPSFALTVTVTDDGIPVTSSSATITVNLTDVNEAPVIADQGFSVIEDSANATVVGTVAASDPDSGAPFSTLGFAITAGNTGTAFAIDAAGQITVASSAAIIDANSPFVLTIEVSDGGGLTDTATVTITVIDINHAPSFTAGTNPTVLEDAGAQTIAGWATAMDDGGDGGQTLTFIVTGNDNPTLFSVQPAVNATSGDLTFTPAADANGVANFMLTLMDNGGGADSSAPQNVSITITAVNDAPGFTKGPDQSVPEDSAAQTIPGWATGISAGPADEAGQTLSFNITSNTNAGLFSAGPVIAPDGTLSYTPTAATSGSADITIELMDDGGGTDTSAAQTFTITVTAINHAPSFTAGANPTVSEDAGAQTINGWATAIDDGGDGGQLLTFNITGNSNPALFSAGPAVNATTGDLSFTPAADANGTATITLELMDDGGGNDTSPSVMFDINVTAVNDVPSFIKGADQTVINSAAAQTVNGWATMLSAGPADEAGQTLSFNITGNDNPGLFSAGPAVNASGDLTYTPSGTAGAANITLNIMDDGGGTDTSADQGFVITIQRAPSAQADAFSGAVTATINGDLTADNGSGADDLGIPAGSITSIGGGSLGGTVTSNPTPASIGLAGGTLAVDSAGVLSLTGTTAAGTFTFDYRITNAAGTSDATVSIVVAASASDDSYTATPQLTLNVPSGGAANSSSVTANDNLGTAVITGFGAATCAEQGTLGSSTATSAGGSIVLNGNGSFSYAPPAGVSNANDTFCYTITGGDTATVTLAIQNQPIIWFIDGAAAAGGNGTQARPLREIVGTDGFVATSGNSAGSAGDSLYLASGSAYTCGLTLLADQNVIGDGSSVGLSDSGVTPVDGSNLPTVSGVQVAISSSNADCITLATDNTIRGIDIGNTGTGLGVIGTTFGLLTMTDASIGGNGAAMDLAGGSVAVVLNDLDSNNTSVGDDGLSLSTISGSFQVIDPMSISGSAVGYGIRLASVDANVTFGDVDITVATTNHGISVALGTGVIAFGNTTVTGGTYGLRVLSKTAGSLAFATLSSTSGTGISVLSTSAPLTVSGGSLTGPAPIGIAASSLVADITSNVVIPAAGGPVYVSLQSGGSVDIRGSIATQSGAVRVESGTGGAITIHSTIATSGTPSSGIVVNNNSGGSIVFSGASKTLNTGANPAVSLTNNSGATIDFVNGGLDIDTTSGAGFSATGGGTVNVTGAGNSVTTTTGTAVNFINTTIGGSGMTFDSVSVSGAADGINLTNAGNGPFVASGGAIQNVTDRGVDISGGSGDVTVGASISTTSTGRSVEATTHTGGTVLLSGAIDDNGLGVRLENNVGSTLRFTGGMDVDTAASSGTEEGFQATGGGVVHVTGTNDVNTSLATGVGVNISGGTTIDAGGVTFRNVSVDGATNGVVLDAAGSGGFTITGDVPNGTDASGGTIQNISQRGISAIGTSNITVRNVSLTNVATTDNDATCSGLVNTSCNAGIHLQSANTVVLDNIDLTGSGQIGINGNAVSGLSLLNSTISTCGNEVNEGCLQLFGLTGTSAITDSDIALPSERAAYINNSSGNLTLTVSGSTFRDTQSSVLGADGLELNFTGTATGTVDVINSAFRRNRTNGLQVLAQGSSTVSADITGSTFDREAGIGIGMDLAASNTAALDFNVIGNPLINGNGGSAVNVFATNNAIIEGRINNNPDIQAGGATASGFGISVQTNENAQGTVQIDGNTISNIGFDGGIYTVARGLAGAACGPTCTAGALHATINNNTVSLTNALGLYDIWVQASDSNTTCANVSNNAASGFTGVAFRQRTNAVASTMLLQGFITDAATTWNNAGNTPANSVSSSNNGTLQAGTCSTPANPMP